MPLDENFPTFHFTVQDPKKSHITLLSHCAGGSRPEPVYTLTRDPSAPNIYSIALTDANFSSITYASLATSLEFPPPSPGSNQNEPKALLPAEFTLNLFNPDSTVIISQHHKVLSGNYWEFTLPKRSFVPPSNSKIDHTYTPPVTERLTFRWRKEGGALSRKQLRCSLVAPGNLPGAKKSAGAGEPDITLAMYSGVGEKSGRGELVIYESNFSRVEMEDLKGLEMVLVLGAKIVNDVYFCQTAGMFNTGGSVAVGGRGRKGSVPPPAVTVAPPTRIQSPPAQYFPPQQPQQLYPQQHKPQQLQQQHPQSFASRMQQQQPQISQPQQYRHPQQQQYPAQQQPNQRYPQQPQQQRPTQQQPQPQPRPAKAAKPTKAELKKQQAEARRIEAEQAQVRAMLAAEEKAAKARQKAAIDAETERLRRVYMQDSRHASHPQAVPTRQRMTARPYTTAPTPAQRRPPPQARPPPQVRPGLLSPDNGKKLDKRKSFLGLFGGGGGGKKLEKKKSSLW